MENTCRRGRVGRVLNIVASRDWVVALLPKSLKRFRSFDLGAGFDGFEQADLSPAAETDRKIKVVQRQFMQGSHSAGIAETKWKNIAKFIVHGEVFPATIEDGFVEKQRWFLKLVSSTRATLWLGAAIVFLAIPALIIWLRTSTWQCLAILLVYALIVKFVVTRV